MQRFRHIWRWWIVLAILSSNLQPLLFSSLPKVECGHKLFKHCQQVITLSKYWQKIKLHTYELATVQVCAQRNMHPSFDLIQLPSGRERHYHKHSPHLVLWGLMEMKQFKTITWNICIILLNFSSHPSRNSIITAKLEAVFHTFGGFFFHFFFKYQKN